MRVGSRRGFRVGAAPAVTAPASVGACRSRSDGNHDPLGVSASADLPAAPEYLSADGTTVVPGAPAAPLTVRLYEDMSCPARAEFETKGTAPEFGAATSWRPPARKRQVGTGRSIGTRGCDG